MNKQMRTGPTPNRLTSICLLALGFAFVLGISTTSTAHAAKSLKCFGAKLGHNLCPVVPTSSLTKAGDGTITAEVAWISKEPACISHINFTGDATVKAPDLGLTYGDRPSLDDHPLNQLRPGAFELILPPNTPDSVPGAFGVPVNTTTSMATRGEVFAGLPSRSGAGTYRVKVKKHGKKIPIVCLLKKGNSAEF